MTNLGLSAVKTTTKGTPKTNSIPETLQQEAHPFIITPNTLKNLNKKTKLIKCSMNQKTIYIKMNKYTSEQLTRKRKRESTLKLQY